MDRHRVSKSDNWYRKTAQQQLLFYPWQQRPYAVYEKQAPIYPTDKENKKLYRCYLCGNGFPKDKIAYWYEDEDTTKTPYIYKQNFNVDQLAADVSQLHILLRKAVDTAVSTATAGRTTIEQENEKRKDTGEELLSFWHLRDPQIDVTEAINFIAQTNLKSLAEYGSIMSGSYYAGYDVNIIRVIEGVITSGGKMYSSGLIPLVSSLGKTDIKKDISDVVKTNTFNIQDSVPICKDCFEDVKMCGGCDKPIIDTDKAYVTQWDKKEYICQQCIENGNYSICIDCGRAGANDEMIYIEDEGKVCSECGASYNKIAPWTSRIEQSAEQNDLPFNSWFNPDNPEDTDDPENDRLYIPYIAETSLQNEDKEVLDFLRIKGYPKRLPNGTVIREKILVTPESYLRGYCQVGKRTWKIGKLLDRLRRNELKGIGAVSTKKRDEINYEYTDNQHGIMHKYETSESRQSAKKMEKLDDNKNLLVVISQNPFDIAGMSTEKDWTSCMTLGSGSQYTSVFDEIEDGGLIAYLIKEDDKEINNPLARVLVKRYSGKGGKNVAMADYDSYGLYGSKADDFKQFVHSWLEMKQGKRIPDNDKTEVYKRRGMNYSGGMPDTIHASQKKNWYKLSSI